MLSKLLLLAIVVVAVWYGFKFFSRPRRAGSSPAIERMAKCARCGVYVPTVNAEPCGREACPYLPSGKSAAP